MVIQNPLQDLCKDCEGRLEEIPGRPEKTLLSFASMR